MIADRLKIFSAVILICENFLLKRKIKNVFGVADNHFDCCCMTKNCCGLLLIVSDRSGTEVTIFTKQLCHS